MKTTETTPTTDKARQTVLSFIQALNSEDFKAARGCISDDLVFQGVMGSREGGDVYMDDMKKMKFKYDIKKVFSDDHDVSLFYDINMSGKTIFSAGWYHVEDGKIKHFNVLFDPRPILPPEKK